MGAWENRRLAQEWARVARRQPAERVTLAVLGDARHLTGGLPFVLSVRVATMSGVDPVFDGSTCWAIDCRSWDEMARDHDLAPFVARAS